MHPAEWLHSSRRIIRWLPNCIRRRADATIRRCVPGARQRAAGIRGYTDSAGSLPRVCAPTRRVTEVKVAWEMPGLAGRPLTIDSHAHINPPRWSQATGAAIRPFDLDALFREQDAAGVNLTVFSQPWFRRPPDR